MARKATSAKDPAPDLEFRRLSERLASGLPPALVVRGEEGWYRHQAALRLVELANERGLEVCRHDTGDPEYRAASLLDDLAGGALFGGGRLVLVRGAGELLRKGSRHHSEAAVKAILARIERPGEDCIVLDAPSLRADSKVAKALAPQELLFSFRKLWDTPPPWKPDPRSVELVQWILGRARERGLKLKPEQAVYVAAATGNDLAALDGQLERAAQAGGTLEAAVVWDPGASPWAIAEQLVDGVAARAVMGLESLFKGGFVGKDGRREMAPEALVAMLGPAVSGKAREALAVARSGGPPRTGSPRQREAVAARVRLRSEADWARMVDDAAGLERRARSGPAVGVNDWAAFALRWRLEPQRRRR
jgi:DNA polymerase III delta subunit